MMYVMCAGHVHSADFRSQLNEIANLRITSILKENLKNHQFCIETNYYQITTDTNFIKKFVSQIKKLEVSMYKKDLTSDEMDKIKYTLLNLNIRVRFVAKISIFKSRK